MESIKVVCWGLGSMGSGIARLLLSKDGVEIVGAIDQDPAKAGHMLNEVLAVNAPPTRGGEVTVMDRPQEVLARVRADIAIIATGSFISDVYPQILAAVEHKINVITIAEEMGQPRAQHPKEADELHRAAFRNGVTVLGTGVNPGFVLDTLIIALTGVCADIQSIKATRINDLSPYGPTVLRTQGVGTTVEEFNKGLEEGRIFGHIGFPESMRLITDALGWELDEVRQVRKPIVSKTRRVTPHVTVEPGMVAGCEHVAYGIKDGRTVITLEHPQQVLPQSEGVETGDYIHIQGTPKINLQIKPEIAGGVATTALAANMIPHVLNARPGLVTMREMPVPAAVLGDMRRLLTRGR